MATTWPTTLPDPHVSFAEEWDMPVVDTTMEMGVYRSRPMFTATPREFTITYPALDADEKTDLTDFLESIGWGGGTIIWTYPDGATTHYVKFMGPLRFQHIGNSKWSTTFRLKKVPDAVAV